ncbi:hypothetical protein [Methanobacterium bryantii]|uniref:Uncharacterized protein n=2 Tax=Methanobacterium TaxID=2160 RepID=A0A2A2H813_METBR|nr:hypothetical protein [Methanobacterium bryantii]PAV05393.1 hypothetical protein ASJ80_09695 [Methanobacterium bryantii]
MNKNILAAIITLFVVLVGFQFAEPAAAVKVVDHGTIQYSACEKITWKAYQYQKNGKINNNFIKIYINYWTKNPKTNKYYIEIHEIDTIAKVTKNSVKITDWNDGVDGGTTVNYAKTKLTAAQYYWRVFKHEITTI